METCRPCGCKGCRSCLICEKEYGIKNQNFGLNLLKSYVYCHYCSKAWTGWNISDYKCHPLHSGEESIDFPGVYIQENFLNENEEKHLLEGIDSLPWDLSQSGRRKQNFGPKCNFKKRKLKVADFKGFPEFTNFVQEKFKEVQILRNFQTIEQCSLEYTSKRGASIDPHIDDCWIWGERIVTVNLLSDSILTMTVNKKLNRYNLDCVSDYTAVLNEDGTFNTSNKSYHFKQNLEDIVVRIPMPRRSLLVMYGSARYDWEHSIFREDINNRRVCLAYREFTPPYLPSGNKHVIGNTLLDIIKKKTKNNNLN